MDIKELDKLELDSKIKHLVYSLNRYGIKTRSSCEGHLNYFLRKPFPHIWLHIIGEKEREEEHQFHTEFIRFISENKIHTFTKYTDPNDIKKQQELKVLHKKWTDKHDQNLASNTLKLKPLFELIKKYNQKCLSYKLCVYEDELVCMNCHEQYCFSQEEQEKNLILMQEELENFANFIDGILAQNCCVQSS